MNVSLLRPPLLDVAMCMDAIPSFAHSRRSNSKQTIAIPPKDCQRIVINLRRLIAIRCHASSSKYEWQINSTFKNSIRHLVLRITSFVVGRAGQQQRGTRHAVDVSIDGQDVWPRGYLLKDDDDVERGIRNKPTIGLSRRTWSSLLNVFSLGKQFSDDEQYTIGAKWMCRADDRVGLTAGRETVATEPVTQSDHVKHCY